MKKFWQKVKAFWQEHEDWLAPLTGLVALIGGLFGLAVVSKKANDKIEAEKKLKEEEEQKRIDSIPEKEMYETYSMCGGATGCSQGAYADSGRKLTVLVTEPETVLIGEDFKYKRNECYINTEGYRLDQLGQFGQDVMQLVQGASPETRVNLEEVNLKSTKKKEEEAQQ